MKHINLIQLSSTQRSKIGFTTFLPIAAGFMMFPTLFFAQTEQQIKEMKKDINLKSANILAKGFETKTLSTAQLKSKAQKLNIPFSGSANGQFFQLKSFDKDGRPMYYITTNAGAAATTGTAKLHSNFGKFNLEGENMRIHEWDGGVVLTSHQEFGGRATQKDTGGKVSDHATHVAGTMIASGVSAAAKGMAPKAFLDAYDWTNDENEMIAAATNGALVSNHSYGYSGGFAQGSWAGVNGWHWLGSDEETEFRYYGKYRDADRDWDLLAQTFPHYLPVKAAGNPRGQGPEPGGEHYSWQKDAQSGTYSWKISTKVRQKNGGELGYDCIPYGALGKNILLVGAAYKIDGEYQSGNDVKMGSFSAFGPVDDGRIKPDIAGVGVGIYSTNSYDSKDYTSMDGTSMASPNVTGSLLLLQEHYKNLNNNTFMKASTLKALALGTANEAGANPGPDYKSGWGLINAYAAATAISVRNQYSLIEEKVLQNGTTETIDVVASGNEPLVATIVWTDPAPKVLPNDDILNDRTKNLVNDLDIRIFKNGQEFFPWKLDPANPDNAATQGDNEVDNVEKITIQNPEAGATYQIRISHKGTLQQNKLSKDNNNNTVVDLEDATQQAYSLVVTGINVNVNTDVALDEMKVNAIPLNYSSDTPVVFKIANKGKQAITNAKLKYKLINQDTNTEVSSAEVVVGNLAPGETLDKTVSIDLSKPFINYKIEGEVSVQGDEVAINNTNSTEAFGTVADLREKGSSHNFGFEDDFNKNGWTVEDANGDGKTWLKYDDPEIVYKGESFAVNLPMDAKGSDDWLFSNPLKLKANTTYRVIFNARKFRDKADYLELHFGTEPKASAMTTQIGERITFPATNSALYKQYYYEFSTPTDQIVYVGFRNKVDANVSTYALGIDEVTFQNASGVPFVDFKADKVKANGYETITLTNNTLSASYLPISGYQWSFEPNVVNYQDGTSATSENPKVVLPQEGLYKVTLKATNAEGEGVMEKTDYITIANTATKAFYTNGVSSIEEGEQIAFTNGSTGNPEPTEYSWTVTPSEGVEFVAPTSATSKDAVIKFNKYGTYKVTLTAKSAHNQDSYEKEITVSGLHEGVKKLSNSVTITNGNDLTLQWERPNMKDLYNEGFEAGEIPVDMTVIDANEDGITWGESASYKNSGDYSAEVKSWTRKTNAVDADDWLMTPKLRKGAEILKYAVRHQYNERYDVYIIPAPASGTIPTLDEMKAGTKVFSFEADSRTASGFDTKSLNIKDHTTTDFYLAFHHRTTKADNGYALYIDDIQLGYDNSAVATGKQSVKKENPTENTDYKALEEKKERIITDNKFGGNGKAQQSIIKAYGITTTPYLVGYRVEKDGTTVQTIDDFNNKVYTENGLADGTYTYKVYAKYSDGIESDERVFQVVIDKLSTAETKTTDLKIYPNPSNGFFTIEAKSGVSSLNAEVYDMSGKLIFKNNFKGNKAELNLTQYPKGVYILNLVDNNGNKQSAKLIIN